MNIAVFLIGFFHIRKYVYQGIFIFKNVNFVSYSDKNTVVQMQIFVRIQLQVFLFIYIISVYLTLRCIILRKRITYFGIKFV